MGWSVYRHGPHDLRVIAGTVEGGELLASVHVLGERGEEVANKMAAAEVLLAALKHTQEQLEACMEALGELREMADGRPAPNLRGAIRDRANSRIICGNAATDEARAAIAKARGGA